LPAHGAPARSCCCAVFGLIALLIACLPTTASAEQPLDIRADRLELDQKARTAVFEGAVQASQADLTLTCTRLIARYDAEGRVAALSAEGDVRVRSEALDAQAATARWDRESGELVLTGKPRVRRGVDRLAGDRIRYWPETGRVVVEGARGTLGSAPDLGGAAIAPAARATR
jgi:lipopolysaccharide export system protein LptA